MVPLAARMVEVLADLGEGHSPRYRSGSGCIVAGRTVLTAAHVVVGAAAVQVRDPGKVLHPAAVDPVFVGDAAGPGPDLALVQITDPDAAELLPIGLAAVDRDSADAEPVKGCHVVGYPRFMERSTADGSRVRDTVDAIGHVPVLSGLAGGLLTVQVRIAPRPLPPKKTGLGNSEWSGMSGGPVLADGLLLGVVTEHAPRAGPSAITATPLTALEADPDHPRWGPGVTDPSAWWARLGVHGIQALRKLPGRPDGEPPPVAGRPLGEVIDPFALEVHRPLQLDDQLDDLPELPDYVPREHDAQLAQVVAAAARGRSGIMVLVGGSSTGKTRACWEALRLLRDQEPGWRLWHPIDPARPDATLRELSAIGPRTVVWLNDAQFYLDVADGGLGERVAAGLRELLRNRGRAPALVLATLWPAFWQRLTTRPANGADPHAQARELLAGQDITVPAAFTGSQQEHLKEARDPRLAQAAAAAQDGQVIQFLAGARELLARYRNAPPAAQALIHTAMDARRLGMGPVVAHAFLEAAAPAYLTDTEWDQLAEDWLKEALAYTAIPSQGIPGPLIRIRPRPALTADPLPNRVNGPVYRLADYLDQIGRRTRADHIPPAGFWAAAANCADPGDLGTLGDAADDRGLYRDAARLNKQASGYGDVHAAISLIWRMHHLHPADRRSTDWASAHVPLDDPNDLSLLLRALRWAGAGEQVDKLAGGVAVRFPLDDLSAVSLLLRALREAGTRKQAAVLAGRAAAHASLGDPRIGRLLDALREAGAGGQVTVLLNRGPAAYAPFDDPGAVADLLDALREAGAREQVTMLLSRDPAAHVPLDDPHDVSLLLRALREAGAGEQVAALAARVGAHAAPEDLDAVAGFLGALREAGAENQVITLAERAAAHAHLDDPIAMSFLLHTLQEAGAGEQAVIAAGRAAAHFPLDDPGAVAHLLYVLRDADAGEQVTILLDRHPAAHASLNNPGLGQLLNALRDVGAGEQVTALLERHPAAHLPIDNPHVVARLLDALRHAGAGEQVAILAGRAAAHAPVDDLDAVADLLGALRAADEEEQVAMLAGRAAAHASLDDSTTVTRLLYALRDSGAGEQVTVLLDRDPAAYAPFDDPGAVADLLDALREAGAREQVTMLLSRDPAAHVPLDDPAAVADLLNALREAAAGDQVTVLAGRVAAHAALDTPIAAALLLYTLQQAGTGEQVTMLAGRVAAHAPLDDPDDVTDLLNALRETGARQEVTVLIDRLPGAGMFELFCKLVGNQDRFQFGREANGWPAKPWGWKDLD